MPASYTFGNENRNDLVGPTYANVDLNLAKTFPIEDVSHQEHAFNGVPFNLLDQTNYSNPDSGVQDGTFCSMNIFQQVPRSHGSNSPLWLKAAVQ